MLLASILILTWDLDQKMKTSATIRKSSSASGLGSFSHFALEDVISRFSARVNEEKQNNFPQILSIKAFEGGGSVANLEFAM